MKETASSWWQQLASRERRLISWGGAGLLVALCYAYLWQPLSAERIKSRASLTQLRADAASMATQADEAVRLRQNTRAALSGPALQAAIQQAVNEAGMDGKSAQITLLDEGRANVRIQSAAFDNWTTLVASLQRETHIRLESCSIKALAETGMVQVQAVMGTGPK